MVHIISTQHARAGLKSLLVRLVHTVERKDLRLFIPLAEAEMEGRKGKVADSTVKNERTALNLLKKYYGEDMRVCDITPGLIEDYDRRNKARDMCANTRAAYLRSLRALLNRLGHHDQQLFANVKTSRAKTTKRAIEQEEVRCISQCCVAPDSFVAKAQQLFLFCLLANGMPFIDVVFLRWEQMKNDIITYHRHKTGTEVIVPVSQKMQTIIDLYGRQDSPYIFGLLDAPLVQQAYRQYQHLLRRYNKALSKIEQMAGLTTHISSYTARHTWASLAVKGGEPLAAISKALGHTSILTTELYLKEISVSDLRKTSYHVTEMIDIP